VKILKVVEKCLKGKGGEEGDVRFAFEEHLLGGVSLSVFFLRICTSPCLQLCGLWSRALIKVLIKDCSSDS
jgi:hypothetical protein